MKKTEVNKNIFCPEHRSKPNVDIIGIAVYMQKRIDLETIFTTNNFVNIQDTVGKVIRS